MRKIYMLLAVCFLLGCSSGRKALEKGRYEEAVHQAIDRLRSNPDNRRARQTLLEAYPRFLAYYDNQLDRITASRDPLKWEKALPWYESINEVRDEILRSPAALDLIGDPISLEDDYQSAIRNATEARYNLGQEFFASAPADRESAKQAYLHFEKADQLTSNYSDARELMEEARELALIIVAVEPIPIYSRALEVSNEFFQDQVAEYLTSSRISPFVEFYSPEEIRTYDLQSDEILRMRFDEFYVGQARIREIVEDRTKDSVVVGTVDVEENDTTVTKNVYGTVRAKLFVFEKEIVSSGILDVAIVDSRSGATLRREKFPGTHTWVDRWGYFNGDERALDSSDKRKIRNRREVSPPPPQELFVEFTKPIYNQLTRYIRNHYDSY